METSTPLQEPRKTAPSRTISAPTLVFPDPDLSLTPDKGSPKILESRVKENEKVRLRGEIGKKQVTFASPAVKKKWPISTSLEVKKDLAGKERARSCPAQIKEPATALKTMQPPKKKAAPAAEPAKAQKVKGLSSSLKKVESVRKTAAAFTANTSRKKPKEYVCTEKEEEISKKAKTAKNANAVIEMVRNQGLRPTAKVSVLPLGKKISVKECVRSFPEETVPAKKEPNLAEPALNSTQAFVDRMLQRIDDDLSNHPCMQEIIREKASSKVNFRPEDRLYKDLVSLRICEAEYVEKEEKRLKQRVTALKPVPRPRDPEPKLADFSHKIVHQSLPSFQYPTVQVSFVPHKAPLSAASTLHHHLESWESHDCKLLS